jgi:hypothetical protein
MLTPAKPLLGVQSVHKSAHFEDTALEPSAVLWEVLRTMETQLQRKGLLPSVTEGSFHPLWFLAETERNVFLWRRGRSLIDKDEFEFWIDVPRLVEKRLKQLESKDAANPFLNPLWGEAMSDPMLAENEKDYLLSLIEVLEHVGPHAHGLSKVGSEVRKELMGRVEKVVLPG